MSRKFLLAAIAAATLLAPAIASAQTTSAQGGYNRLMVALDTDRDGAVSHQEMETGRSDVFNRVDTNRDGAISTAERNAARPSLQTSGALAASVDADGDGFITRAEFMARPYPAFDRFDADDNNVLDSGETHGHADGNHQPDPRLGERRPGKD